MGNHKFLDGVKNEIKSMLLESGIFNCEERSLLFFLISLLLFPSSSVLFFNVVSLLLKFGKSSHRGRKRNFFFQILIDHIAVSDKDIVHYSLL